MTDIWLCLIRPILLSLIRGTFSNYKPGGATKCSESKVYKSFIKTLIKEFY